MKKTSSQPGPEFLKVFLFGFHDFFIGPGLSLVRLTLVDKFPSNAFFEGIQKSGRASRSPSCREAFPELSRLAFAKRGRVSAR
jgi:hypothetical protein